MSERGGILADLAELIGPDAAAAIGRKYSGEYLRIPAKRTQTIQERNAQIVQEYDGSNTAELASRYRLSTRRVRQIVRNHRQKK
jgi:Mor family transcriptional regulator